MTYDAEDNLRLKIHFTGKPNPKIKCVFNNNHLITDDRTQMTVDDEFIELRICDLNHTDAGIYEFVAENEIGKDSAVVPVTVAGTFLFTRLKIKKIYNKIFVFVSFFKLL